MRKIIIIFLVCLLFFSMECQSSPQSKAEGKKMAKGNKQTEVTREPAVAGAFYPGDPVQLSRMIAEFFNRAKKEEVSGEIVGLISPHAGYVYSGQVAAYAYKLLEGLNFDVVVVIAPSHTLPFSGSSVFNGAFYQTPLGKIEVDYSLRDGFIDKFGAEPECFDPYAIFKFRDENYIATPEVFSFREVNAIRKGLEFAKVYDREIKPDNDLVQIFGARVTRGILDIKEYQLKKFLRGEILKVGSLPNIERGFVIIRFKSLPIAIGKYNGSEIRSAVKRERRIP